MIIEGKRVVLRPVKVSDEETLFRWRNDPKFMGFCSSRTGSLPRDVPLAHRWFPLPDPPSRGWSLLGPRRTKWLGPAQGQTFPVVLLSNII